MEELANWTCDQCKKVYRFFEVRQPVDLVGQPGQIKRICAQCQKDLTREKKIALEWH